MFRLHLDRDSDDYKRSVPFVLAGLLTELVGSVMLRLTAQTELGWSLLALALILLGVGLAYLARSKNRSPAWAGLAFLSFLGWFLLASLPERPEQESIKSSREPIEVVE